VAQFALTKATELLRGSETTRWVNRDQQPILQAVEKALSIIKG
jgi:hypothetical protein